MQVVTPDLVAEVCGLSLGVLAGGAAVALMLWLLGWKTHRFWIVLLTTVLAGVYGLHEGETFRSPPLVAGLVLALAAGVLALALMRLFVFGAGGLAGLIALQSSAVGFDQPLVVFVAGGLLGLLLFRWFVMALSSLAGAVLLSYSGLGLLHVQGLLDALAWSEQNGTLLNWACVLMAMIGFVVQFFLGRTARRREEVDEEPEYEPRALPLGRLYRRAG